MTSRRRQDSPTTNAASGASGKQERLTAVWACVNLYYHLKVKMIGAAAQGGGPAPWRAAACARAAAGRRGGRSIANPEIAPRRRGPGDRGAARDRGEWLRRRCRGCVSGRPVVHCAGSSHSGLSIYYLIPDDRRMSGCPVRLSGAVGTIIYRTNYLSNYTTRTPAPRRAPPEARRPDRRRLREVTIALRGAPPARGHPGARPTRIDVEDT